MIPPWEYNRIITTAEIIKATEKVFDIQITGKNQHCRTRRRADARAVAMNLSMQLQKFSHKEVAMKFGDRCHTGVVYAEQRLQRSPELQRDLNRVKSFMRV